MAEQQGHQVWFITGSSSGFGEQFALQALARGDKVIASARNATTRPELQHLKDKGAALLDLDVTGPKTEIEAKMQEAIAIYGHIDILINNAGYVSMGFCEEVSEETLQAQLNTNSFGAINITQALLPHFRSRRSGKIAFIGSVMGVYTMPMVFPYAASKNIIMSFSETLAYELSSLNIHPIVFHIGHFRTPVIGAAQFSLSQIEDYGPVMGKVLAAAGSMGGNQPGDPVKGVSRMIDVLTGEGEAKGKKMPVRMPIGGDAVEVSRGEAEKMLDVIREWGDFGGSTDFEGLESAKEKLVRLGTWRPEEQVEV